MDIACVEDITLLGITTANHILKTHTRTGDVAAMSLDTYQIIMKCARLEMQCSTPSLSHRILHHIW